MRARGAAPRGGSRGHGKIKVGNANIVLLHLPSRTRSCASCGERLAKHAPPRHRYCRQCWSYSIVARVVTEHEAVQAELALRSGGPGRRWKQ